LFRSIDDCSVLTFLVARITRLTCRLEGGLGEEDNSR